VAPERWQGATADAIIAATTAALVAAYHEHRHLMRAVLLTDDPCVYARAASVEQHAAERLVQVLPAPAGANGAAFRQRVEFGVRAALAVLQQTVLFDERTKSSTPRSKTDLARELADLMTSYIGSPRRRGRSAGPRAKRRRKGTTR
jgi:hypothetical protein